MSINKFKSTALALLFSTVLPFAAPDIFIYKSAYSAEGPTIPSWVAASCCGPKDVHRLTPDQVTDLGDYYEIEGYPEKIPKVFANGVQNDRIKPSQDGDYWAFWSDEPAHWSGNQYNNKLNWNESRHDFYCLFIPMSI